MNSYFFQSALLANGWQQNVRATVKDGIFQTLSINSEPQACDEKLGVVIPAMPNVHSHVFQRAMAGLTEYKSAQAGSADSFWSWRKLMYQLANEMDAKSLYQVAKNCYQEMKEAGYASVCEFHYVHRELDNHDDYYSMSEAVLEAAADVGLPITLLPVLYAYSAMGDQALIPQQQRFELSVEEYIDLYNHLNSRLQHNQYLGLCFHSIRAVNQDQMHALIKALPKDVPIHIHIAEQQAEIDQSLAHYGQRPVQWLYDHFDVNQRWCLVHATHLDQSEVELIADSGAVAVICPLTEANLGDGVFPMPSYQSSQGIWAIGSDSHIEINPSAEFKMLEYSQRLKHQQRNICCDHEYPNTGTWMWLNAIRGGNQACGFGAAGITKGNRATVIELQPKQNELSAEHLLDSWIFSDQSSMQSHQL